MLILLNVRIDRQVFRLGPPFFSVNSEIGKKFKYSAHLPIIHIGLNIAHGNNCGQDREALQK
jgi:hypothetical protein